MRTYTWILVWGTLIAWSCHGDHSRVESRLEGLWELRAVSEVTIAGTTRKDYASGNGNMLQFDGSAYNVLTQGQLAKKGSYSVLPLDSAHRGTGCLTPEEQKRFPYQLVTDGGEGFGPFCIQGDSLILSSSCIGIDDAWFRVYKKIRSM